MDDPLPEPAEPVEPLESPVLAEPLEEDPVPEPLPEPAEPLEEL